MCHRIYKNIVPTTNKHDLPRDFTVYESIMQALRFISEGWCDPRHSSTGKGLQDFINCGFFNGLYFRSDRELANDKEIHSGLVCDATVSDIQLHGRRWTTTQSHEHGLPQSPLNNLQAGELGNAYKEQGDFFLKSSRNISYFDGVSYKIQGADICNERGIWKEADWVRVKVCVGDILEVTLEVGSQYFVKVIGIMRHLEAVFFVVAWLSLVGQHPRLCLPEYKQEPLFQYSTFFSLKTVDHPRYVNRTIFHTINGGRLIRNDWIFSVV
jgi:hypothetical protein